MLKRLVIATCMCCLLLSNAWANDDAKKLIVNAESVINSVIQDPKQEGLRNLLKSCHAVMIIPSYVKAGLVFGGAGGTGVLLARNTKTNKWTAPAFYGLGAASVGVQLSGANVQL